MGQAERNLAHFRQVCSLKLPLEVLSAAISEALRPILGFSCMMFSMATPEGKTGRVWLDRPLPVTIHDDYMRNFTDRPKQALLAGQDVALRQYHGVRVLPDWREFHESAFYHAIWKPLGMHAALTMFLREPGRPLALGSFLVYRAPGERSFSAADIRLYESLLPFMTHAFASVQGPCHSTEWADSGEHGLVLIDGKDAMHMDEATQGLLYQLSETWVRPHKGESALMRVVAQRLRDIFSDRDGKPPVEFVVNRWGRFSLRANWIGQDDLIGISIDKQEPMELHMVRNLRCLPLSPALRPVCLLAASRMGNAEIARELKVSVHTVHDQLAVVYGLTGAADRLALADLLKRPFWH